MKSCNYYYKGKLIGDIIKLDDFLLSKQKYLSKVSDQIFQQVYGLTPEVINIKNKLDKAQQDNLKEIKEWNQAKKQIINDEELVKLKRPSVGLTEFLSGQRDINGQLYFPEFDEGEYWSRRFYAWTQGKKATEPNGSDGFTEAEIELFFNGDESQITAIPLGNDKEWRDSEGKFKIDSNNKDRVKFGSDEQNYLRELMEDKWQNQAKYGTEIHNVLQQFFSYTKNTGTLWADLLSGPDAALHLANFESNLRKNTNSGITDLTSKERVAEIVEYAKGLKKYLEETIGDSNLTFFSEYTLSSPLNKEYEGRTDLKVIGRVDLIAVDSKGNPHIIDYKTSPKDYESYSGAKKLGFTYQLATYERMLRKLGIYTGKTDLLIAPIKMENFRKEGDKWVFDKVVGGSKQLVKSISDDANREKIINNINEYIEQPQVLEGQAINVIENVKKYFEQWFPRYGNNEPKTDEEIAKLIKDQGADKKNSKGKYEFKLRNSVIEGKTETELFRKVKSYYATAQEKSAKNAERVVAEIIKAKEANQISLQLQYADDWMSDRLSKYLSNDWVVMDDGAGRAARQFGVILFYNQGLDLMQAIRISANPGLREMHSFGQNRNNLVGAHETDTIENSKSSSLILKAAQGNIELMETMLILNSLTFNDDVKLGGIEIIHPAARSEGISASNKELLYNWNKLTKHKPLEIEDQFKTGRMKLITDAEACYQEFRDIMQRNLGTRLVQEMQDYVIPMQDYFANLPINPERALDELHNLRRKLEESFPNATKTRSGNANVHSNIGAYNLNQDKILYQRVMAAIQELNGITIRQILKDHKNYLEHHNIITKGIQGNMLDNAGNFGNQLLNQITSIALEGYQNARDFAFPKLNTMRQNAEKLKKGMGYSGLTEHTFGNQTSLYKGMTEFTSDGDFRFINPWKDNSLHPAQAEFLKYALIEINQLIHPNQTKEEVEAKIRNNDVEFFQVPLVEASFASKIDSEGWMGWMKNKLSRFRSKEAFLESLRDFQSEFFDDTQEDQYKSDEEVFKVVNLLRQGLEDRTKTIESKKDKFGEGFFERDIEAILSQLIWAYSTNNALSERMTLIKAAYISLNVMGNEQNQSFEKDEEFFRNFVANRINHMSIEDKHMRELKGAVGMVQSAVSWMALAFSPTQFSYQSIEGIWKACKLIITKPDGTETFTAQNMYDAAKIVYKELCNFSDIPSVTVAINAQYGINDMDNASFADNNTSNRHGIFNFLTRFAYRFSSRPDFYNRMTVFVSQMKADGSWEAHSVNKETGELIYDYALDKRFAAYAKDPEGKNVTNWEEYNKAKSLYYATATQMVTEGVRNKDGSLFRIGQPLPKAYSNLESEARKAVGDNMYGYYDSTKKSLFQAIFVGSLMMQMRTYWSAKKNQYFAPGGIKAQGKWVQMEAEAIDKETGKIKTDENGNPIMEKYFYAKNEKGEVDVFLDPVPESDPNCSSVPFRQWKGKYEEGVILTIAGMLNDMRTNGFKNMLEMRFGENADPELKQVYIANLKLLFTDLVMYGIIGFGATMMLGDWADDELKKARKSGHMDDAMQATLASFIHRTVKSSGLDFAWWKAIFDISMDWNPMAISYMANELAAIANFIVGDIEFSDLAVKSFSAARQVRPIIECISNDD